MDFDKKTEISINALREESDFKHFAFCKFAVVFQSTLSVRRATFCHMQYLFSNQISINALREESDHLKYRLFLLSSISINALREESDLFVRVLIC